MKMENPSKKLRNGHCNTIHDKNKGGMKVKNISEILRMPRSTVSNEFRRQKAETFRSAVDTSLHCMLALYLGCAEAFLGVFLNSYH